MLSRVENEKSFITSEPGWIQTSLLSYTDELEASSFGFTKVLKRYFYLGSKKQRPLSAADLHLCFSDNQKTGFLMTLLI